MVHGNDQASARQTPPTNITLWHSTALLLQLRLIEVTVPEIKKSYLTEPARLTAARENHVRFCPTNAPV